MWSYFFFFLIRQRWRRCGESRILGAARGARRTRPPAPGIVPNVRGSERLAREVRGHVAQRLDSCSGASKGGQRLSAGGARAWRLQGVGQQRPRGQKGGWRLRVPGCLLGSELQAPPGVEVTRVDVFL